MCGDRLLGDDEKAVNMVSSCKYEARFNDKPSLKMFEGEKGDCRRNDKINIKFMDKKEWSPSVAQLVSGSVTVCDNNWQVDPDPISLPGFSFNAWSRPHGQPVTKVLVRAFPHVVAAGGITSGAIGKADCQCRFSGSLHADKPADFFIDDTRLQRISKSCENNGDSIDCGGSECCLLSSVPVHWRSPTVASDTTRSGV